MVRALSPDDARPFRAHFGELRNRLFWWLGWLIIFTLVAFYFRGALERLIVEPLHQDLYYTTPSGGVDFLFRTVIGFGLIPSLPILIYQILRFLEPALPLVIRRQLMAITFGSIILTFLGVGFAYLVGLPIVLQFFSTFTTSQVQALISADQYLSFVTDYIITIALLFQLPLAILLINKVVPLNVKKINRYQIFIIIGFFLLSGLITPTFEPLSQLVMTIPMILLFELTVLIVYLANRHQGVVTILTDQLNSAEQMYQAENYLAALAAVEPLRQDRIIGGAANNLAAKIYIKTQRFEAAVIASRQAIQRAPNVPSHHANLGIALFGQHHYQAAELAFGVALKLRPDSDKYQQLRHLAQEKMKTSLST